MKLISLLLMTVSLVVASDSKCKINIDKVEHSEHRFTIELSYVKDCEVLIDHEGEDIILSSKKHSEQNLSSTKNKKADTQDSNKIEKMLAIAKTKIGDSYQPAKTGPDHFDCSGFVYYLHKQVGVKIPRTSLHQSQSGQRIPREKLQRGDMVFFDTHNRGHVNHSGIYLGDGNFIHSSSGKAYAVTISNLDKGFYKDKFQW